MDLSVFISGLVLGILSGLHCMGMCGPIAMLVYGRGKLRYALYYNAGRVLSYMLLGLLIGSLSSGIQLLGYQKNISLGLGFLVLLSVFMSQMKSIFPLYPSWGSRLISLLQKQLKALVGSQSALSFFLTGALNGLLPCGMVYLALSMALASGQVSSAMLLMFGFGMGTVPLMIAVRYWQYVVTFIGNKLARRWLLPSLSFLVGMLLIVRGMELDIPYVSPVLSSIGLSTGVSVCGH